MKTSKIIAAALALSMGLGNAAIAQSGPYGGRGDGSRAEQRDSHRGGDRAQERRGDRRADRRDEWRDDRRDDRRDWRRDARRDARHDARAAEWRHDARRDERWDRRDPRWDGHWSRGAGPQHNIYRGGRLPPSYHRGRVYVINDWRGHRLPRPPPGYHWVQAGGDYVLAAIATGVILSILLSH